MSEPISTEVEVSDVPIVLHKGVYTLWEKPDGSLRIQYKRSDQEEESFIELPGAIRRLAQAGAEGKVNPMEMMKEMMKMAGGFGRPK
jgi:hypothetical protein